LVSTQQKYSKVLKKITINLLGDLEMTNLIAMREKQQKPEEAIPGIYRWNGTRKMLTKYQSLDGRFLFIPRYIISEMLVNLGAKEFRVVDRLKDLQFVIKKGDLERYGKYEQDPDTKEWELTIDLKFFERSDWSNSDIYLRMQS